MIKLYWEPKDNTSIVLADGLVESFVEKLVQLNENDRTLSYKIGSELILNYCRVAIKEGKLPHTELEFYTEGGNVLIVFDKNGVMDSPIGYPDYFEDSLTRIIGW